MADVEKVTNELKIDNLFVDGDTRVLTLKDPRSDITQADIADLNSFLQANQVIEGDKNQGAFARIATVTRVRKRRIVHDLT